MSDHPLIEHHPAVLHTNRSSITRIPRAALARRLQHEPEADAPFMDVLYEVLPDESARLAYLNHLAWEARS